MSYILIMHDQIQMVSHNNSTSEESYSFCGYLFYIFKFVHANPMYYKGFYHLFYKYNSNTA
jgi:hypothetical protein